MSISAGCSVHHRIGRVRYSHLCSDMLMRRGMGIQLFQCIGEVKQGKGGEWSKEVHRVSSV